MVPAAGAATPRFDFEAVVRTWWPEVPAAEFAAAFTEGEAFLASSGASARSDYHRLVLAALGLDKPPAGLLDELEQPRPAAELVEVFADVVAALEALRAAGVPVAVVTDNWSTIRDLYADLGLSNLIDAFAISEELGCTKPDPRMYRAGSDALGLEPHECAFVDDDPDLVAAAIDLGYHGFVIDRGTPPGCYSVPTITSLAEIVALAGRAGSIP